MSDKDTFRAELVSWDRVYAYARSVAHAIIDDGFRPDAVVAIARGGYVPARILCDLLDIYQLHSIRVVHYRAGASKQAEARLTDPLAVDMRGKRVLVVDDVSDTGDTLAVARRHLAEAGAADTRIAVLLHKEVSKVMPEYYAEKLVEWRWMIFPWAVIEDVGGFLAKVEPRPGDPAAALELLRAKYGIEVAESAVRDAFKLRGW